MRFVLFLTLPLYALDQLTKWLILHRLAPEDLRVVIPDFFALVYVTNDGAAFGSFKNMNVLFIVLCFGAIVVIIGALRTMRPDPWRNIPLALLLAGVLGNLTDRLWHGHVIDFLLFDLHLPYAHPWPAFNVADSCICIAVVCFIIHSLKQNRKAI